MKPTLKRSCIAALTLAALAGSANATTLFYESFDFPAGDLSTESSNAWDDTGTTIETGSLSFGTLATAGNRVTMSDDTSWTSTGTSLDGFLDNGDTLWFSVLINIGDTGTNPDFGFALGSDRLNDSNNIPMTSSGNGLGFRVKGGLVSTAWVGGSASSNFTSPTGLTNGQTYLIVGEILFGATALDVDTVNLYLPDTGLTLGSVVQSQTATLDQSTFDTITFSNKGTTPRDQVDEIRFGDTYASVTPVPEPSAALLVSVGLLALLRRRRA